MEWVETTGKTVDEAKEQALDQLGVDEDDAEFVTVEEPKVGLFGRVRQEARIRARVRPQAPPPKTDRRERKRRPTERNGNRRARGGAEAGSTESEGDSVRSADDPVGAPRSGRRPRGPAAGSPSPTPKAPRTARAPRQQKEDVLVEAPSWEDQAELAKTFVAGLVASFEVEGEVVAVEGTDGGIEIEVDGRDLGLLVGPKGATLQAVQELSRIALQRYTGGASETRLRVDVGGYRQRRHEALARFAEQVASEVESTGTARSLEPMGSADRKVVHDALAELAGVTTSSHGEDPRRYVVIAPAHSSAEVD